MDWWAELEALLARVQCAELLLFCSIPPREGVLRVGELTFVCMSMANDRNEKGFIGASSQ
jgi:hypothetical protein